MDHLGAGIEWDLARKRDGLFILPPFVTRENTGTYTGLIDALRSNMGYIRRSTQEICILSGSHTIFNTTFDDAIAFHEASQADITVMYNKPLDIASRGEAMADRVYLGVDASGRVYDVEIGPDMPRHPNLSMDVYIINKETLIKLVDEAFARGRVDWHRDILQRQRDDLRIFGYGYDGYVCRVDSILSFYQLNMDLLDELVRVSVLSRPRPIYTKIKDEVPARYCNGATVDNSLVADGCRIHGDVSGSILFRNVEIAEGAHVKNCILMQGVNVGAGAVLEHVIVDKSAIIKPERRLASTPDYPVVITKNAVI